MNQIAEAVLDFWFGPEDLSPTDTSDRMPIWFRSNADFDYDIERRFGKLVSLATKGEFDNWQDEPKTALALIILLDQFPRNLFRGTAKAFATDAKSLAVTKYALEQDYLDLLSPIEQVFLLMPFQHVEDLEDQVAGIEHYQRLARQAPSEWQGILKGVLDFARRHHVVIEKFGRFPHRNSVLNRDATTEESAYLDEGGDRF